jgi:hypothetical protein
MHLNSLGFHNLSLYSSFSQTRKDGEVLQLDETTPHGRILLAAINHAGRNFHYTSELEDYILHEEPLLLLRLGGVDIPERQAYITKTFRFLPRSQRGKIKK